MVCKPAAMSCGEELRHMANPACEVLVTEAPLDAPPQNHRGDAGAINDFWGVVRRLEGGREIIGIEYEAHREMAEHQLRQIAEQAVETFALELIVVHHRIGFIAAGELSLFMPGASGPRPEAFPAGEWGGGECKKKVRVWKQRK